MSDARSDHEARVDSAMVPAGERAVTRGRVEPEPVTVSPTKAPVTVLQSSDQVTDIVTALVAAQSTFKPVVKDRVANVESRGSGVKYSYGYATLAAVLDAIRPALNANGIAIVQSANVVSGDRAVVLQVETRFLHVSGQWIGSVLRLPLHDATPQGMGSLMTYLRRYGVSSLAGVASEEDDDGAEAQRGATAAARPAASKPAAQRQTAAKPATTQATKPADSLPANELPPESAKATRGRAAAKATDDRHAPLGTEGTISKADRAQLFKVAKECSWSEADVKSLIKQLYGYESTSQITTAQLPKVLSCIEYPGDNGVTFEDVNGVAVVVVKRGDA